ncbi:efflux RND transporter permease subunit [Pedobacter sp. SYP-B3415]|uniref:efflux RND transporter permease subunit n=1 Tax=Pedobacter sp. SYP-B3415 TaxID=2496641 RepID=UPI00101D2CFD|nr:efflux RND transporter permease subunit [Pedobacter sp. SYP-B3415]
MISFFLKRPIGVLVSAFGVLLIGVLSIISTPITPLPDVDIPRIQIKLVHRGYSASEMERNITGFARRSLTQLSGLKKLNAKSYSGFAIVTLDYQFGTKIDVAFVNLNDRLDRLLNELPVKIERPIVSKSNLSDIPVFYLNVFLKKSNVDSIELFQLSDFAQKVIKRRLEQRPEIAYADISGLAEKHIIIQPKVNVTRALSLDEEDFRKLMKQSTASLGNLDVADGEFTYRLEMLSQRIASISEVRKIPIKVNGTIFHLSDLATVDEEITNRSTALFGLDRCITMAIIKQPDASLTDLRKATTILIDEFKKDYPTLHFEQTEDQSSLLEFAINNLQQDLVLGSLFSFIILALFLGDARIPLLIAIVIPACVIVCLLLFYVLDLSVNIISLAGLVLAVGLMVDNAVIVIDNITYYVDKGYPVTKACAIGTEEVFRPILASAFTTTSVFVPLVYMSGISGALFYDQAIAIAAGLFSSILISSTVLPVCYSLIYRRRVKPTKKFVVNKINFRRIERIYDIGFNWVFNNKQWVGAIVLTLVAINVLLFISLKKENIPRMGENECVIIIDWNVNVSDSKNTKSVKLIVNKLKSSVDIVTAMVGQQTFLIANKEELTSSQARIYVHGKNRANIQEISSKIKLMFAKSFPKATIRIEPQKNLFQHIFDSSIPPLVVKISSNINADVLPDIRQVKKIKTDLEKKFPNIEIHEQGNDEIAELTLRKDKMMLLDVSKDDIYKALSISAGIYRLGSFEDGDESFPVFLGSTIRTPNWIAKSMVKNSRGQEYPLDYFIYLSQGSQPRAIYGDEASVFTHLDVFVQNVKPVAEHLSKINESANENKVTLEGSYFDNLLLTKEMLYVLFASITLLYFILAAQFESLIQPIIVLFEIPISMSGALIFLFVTGSTINLLSLIGLIVMCGIIINDSILKIDAINQLMRVDKVPLLEAIHIAGRRRLKSITMTSLITIFSVVPFLFGDDLSSILQRPLSASLIGGMLIGTPISLYFIPLVYWSWYKSRSLNLKSTPQ